MGQFSVEKPVPPGSVLSGNQHVELDPLYVDVIARRYEAATGEPVVLVETGETFEALAALRAQEQEQEPV